MISEEHNLYRFIRQSSTLGRNLLLSPTGIRAITCSRVWVSTIAKSIYIQQSDSCRLKGRK